MQANSRKTAPPRLDISIANKLQAVYCPFPPPKRYFYLWNLSKENPEISGRCIACNKHVDTDIERRLIDLFVDSLNLSELGFKTQYEENARPAHAPKGIGLPFFSLSAAV